MSVLERYQEIGIIKSMGAMPWDVFRMIWTETVILCLLGGVIGIGIAFALSKITDLLIRRLLPYTPTGSLIAIDSQPGLHHARGRARHRPGQRHLSGLAGGPGPAARIHPQRRRLT